MNFKVCFPIISALLCAGCHIRPATSEKGAIEARLSAVETRLAAIAATLGIEQETAVRSQRDIPVGASPIIGAPEAPHTMVVFLDIECGFCAKRFPDLLRWQKRYPKLLNIVVKHYPLVPRSEAVTAASVALVANEFGRYEDVLLQLLENRKRLGEPFYGELPSHVGVSSSDFSLKRASIAPKTAQIIADDLALGKLLGVKGTPTVYLDGYEISGVDEAEILNHLMVN